MIDDKLNKKIIGLTVSISYFFILIYIINNSILATSGFTSSAYILSKDKIQLTLMPIFISGLMGLIFPNQRVKRFLKLDVILLIFSAISSFIILIVLPSHLLNIETLYSVKHSVYYWFFMLFYLFTLMVFGNLLGMYLADYMPSYTYDYDEEELEELRQESENWSDYLGEHSKRKDD